MKEGVFFGKGLYRLGSERLGFFLVWGCWRSEPGDRKNWGLYRRVKVDGDNEGL